ncbi:lysozyme g-like protein 1 isoform X1 [Canis lupus baileyi]|uniref:Lysozyme g-like protein n=2 Tax=Canis lupus familiaris TaxID=9615 RepID=A0A8C0NT03_CANLF|nr:lysozyme g-like protein 1 isoform X1 [Canis lupus familiaris]XP_022280301.1 lysozyme g-like protein 1 isoform X1 [Canis lupus familiaris]XP_022280303.1 lysozyme g-like protein 1 isoform X1 [Canis lupus familiaris]XP_022280304.1 lysozyme g-like protein 1 isoform X1 [Canis lupus familiaris]XP_025319933.1 lysozyme g-like protein 1 isoform X1 [Canis lupus dingo]XP_025319943.1 lysozyme g-like protein 1 isoform X1 [Canis lupus dingo]XP_025319952.1 lysozyme g-like protein 1 isoform X1 [Canis lupu|eukprot:XP_005626081.1 lysozyme g-like protein 1 [Canis lupus familiaris]
MSVLWLLLGLLALTDSSESSNWGCYGNIRNVETPGASCGIGKRHGLNYCGVRASERLAEIDMPYLLRYQPVIHTVGQKYCVDPAVIAGVLSRESHGSNAMVNVGNTGNGIGVVQDPGFYAPTSWISESQVSQITEVLTVRIKEIQRRFPTWTSDQHLKGGLCAYAGGPGYIRSSQDLSCDFCNDVLARAKYFKRHGF